MTFHPYWEQRLQGNPLCLQGNKLFLPFIVFTCIHAPPLPHPTSEHLKYVNIYIYKQNIEGKTNLNFWKFQMFLSVLQHVSNPSRW